MRIRVMSDIHLEFRDFTPPPEPEEARADAVVLAGDIAPGFEGLEWAARTFPDRPVVFVLGNHELYRQVVPDFLGLALERARSLGINLLCDDEVAIDGVRFLGATLWTDYRLRGDAWDSMVSANALMSDHRQISVRDASGEPRWVRPEDMAAWHEGSKRWLDEALRRPRREGERVVVVTHHAISRRSLHPTRKGDSLAPAFISDLESFVAASRAALWIHGHTHWSVDYRIGETRVVANQRGYPREPENFDPLMTVEV